ncbi:MAG: hypothetical protein A2902_03205 [Elusimicrobia bacterium RIFCSPLOWO2_01_FULL_64_13]|nr:MAG: hypothetical protein A2636_04470 [Elusimicrobia bacterium RIFCSPHIGHO2_01_FULL_64_10]OGR96230.1 MAG: hypothetical protein A2902_03205 [Elusimicrobia bacterium RIFCSPLOWO2_01_FULL_64_13]
MENEPKPRNILVIDDDRETCAFFEGILERQGFKVAVAYDGKSALDLLAAEAAGGIDLIILDLMMPGYGGYEVLKELKPTRHAAVPIFVVTARVLDSGTVQLIRAEANVREFWTKPVDIKKFIDKTHALFGTQPPKKKQP